MAASQTAHYVALYRALETQETSREPLFRDPYAAHFLPRELTFLLGAARYRPLRGLLVHYADWRAPGARTSAIGRTRFIDDAVRKAVGEGVRQLVILGAGYDCRAHRMPELADARVFEIDRAETQAKKRALLAARGRSRRDVTYVALDFIDGDLREGLSAAGWDLEQPSLFLLEGVSNYLTEAAMERLLGAIARARGSKLVFTYVHRGVLDRSVHFEGGDKLVHNVQRIGEPWRFGLLPSAVAPFLAKLGLTLEEDLGADEYRRRYLPDGSDDLRGYAFYRIAVARCADS